MSDEKPDKGSNRPQRNSEMMTGVGAGVGAGIGTVIFAATDNPAWIAIGAGAGVAVGVAISASQRSNH